MDMDIVKLVILVIVSYLIGAIPTGMIIGAIHGVDLREHGSGKIGATNVNRVIGRRAALLVFVLDVIKGALPVLMARLIGWPDANMEAIAIGMTAIAALAGHIWSIWIRIFTGSWGGGRGVATGIGTMMMVNPLVALFGVAVGIAVIIISRYVSLGSILGIVAGCLLMVILAFWEQFSPWLVIYAIVCGTLIIVIHHDNIQRLLKGTERKLTWGSRQPPATG